MFLACHSSVLGAICIADAPKPEARGVVAALHALGIECHMITGDNWRTARAVAESVGIKNIKAEVMPAWKKDKVRNSQEAFGSGVAQHHLNRTQKPKSCGELVSEGAARRTIIK